MKLKVNNPYTNGSSIKTSSLITHVLQDTFERERCASNAIIYDITESALLTTPPPPRRITGGRMELIVSFNL